jgi:uroporphyrin-3 C-methyltransferase
MPAWMPWLLALSTAAAAVALARQSSSRQQSLEQLVRRQEASQAQATEARWRGPAQSAELVRDTAQGVAAGRPRGRGGLAARSAGGPDPVHVALADENVVGDIEAALRVAMQQSQITGSAEPLAAAPQAVR